MHDLNVLSTFFGMLTCIWIISSFHEISLQRLEITSPRKKKKRRKVVSEEATVPWKVYRKCCCWMVWYCIDSHPRRVALSSYHNQSIEGSSSWWNVPQVAVTSGISYACYTSICKYYGPHSCSCFYSHVSPCFLYSHVTSRSRKNLLCHAFLIQRSRKI